MAFAASNIDPQHSLAWSENAGWLDLSGGSQTLGVRVLPTILSGYIWAENIGWINLGDGTPSNGTSYANNDGFDCGVNIDPLTSDLFGLAWSENVGWINFDTRAALGSSGQQARVDFTAGRLRGYAWGENIGWINFDDATLYAGFIWPACHQPFADADDDHDVDQIDFAYVQRCLSATGGILDGCECFNRPEVGFPNGDNDVDLNDLDAFAACASGPGIPADANCTTSP